MSKRRTRDRQLAKLAARRAAERRQKKRQRILAGVVGGAAFVLVALVLFFALSGNGKAPRHRARNSPPATTAPTTAPSPTPSPRASYVPGTGQESGTVNPTPAPTEVACSATAPPDAGKPKPQFNGPPPLTIDPAKSYVAVMKTSCGTIKFELDPVNAPWTTNSFVFLADHHYFDGQYFHRLDTSIDVVQGGDPVGDGSHGPGYAIPDELNGNETYPPGTLAMANGGPNTGGSQFFIITGPNGHKLDDNNAYTVFGHVIGGMDVAQNIQKMPIKDPAAAAQGDLRGQAPQQAIYIDSVTIIEKKAAPSPSPTDGSVIPTTDGSGKGPGG